MIRVAALIVVTLFFIGTFSIIGYYDFVDCVDTPCKTFIIAKRSVLLARI